METQDSVTVKLFKPSLNHDTNHQLHHHHPNNNLLFIDEHTDDTSSDMSSNSYNGGHNNREFQVMIEDLRRERKQMEEQSLFESQQQSKLSSSSIIDEEEEEQLDSMSLDTIQALNVLQNYILKEYETLKSKITRELKESWTIIDENGDSIHIPGGNDDETLSSTTIQSLHLEHYKINKIFHERLTTIYNNFNREYFSFNKATTLLELHNATTEICAHYDRMSLKFSRASKSFKQVPQIQIVQSSPLIKKGMSALYEDIDSGDEESDDDDSDVERVEGSILTEKALQQYRNQTNMNNNHQNNYSDHSPSYTIVTSSTVLTGPFSPLVTPINPVHNQNIFDDHLVSPAAAVGLRTVTEDGSSVETTTTTTNENSMDSVKTVHRVPTTTTQQSKTAGNGFFTMEASRSGELDSSTIVIELLRVIVEQGLQINETFNQYYANEFYKNAKLKNESK